MPVQNGFKEPLILRSRCAVFTFDQMPRHPSIASLKHAALCPPQSAHIHRSIK